MGAIPLKRFAKGVDMSGVADWGGGIWSGYLEGGAYPYLPIFKESIIMNLHLKHIFLFSIRSILSTHSLAMDLAPIKENFQQKNHQALWEFFRRGGELAVGKPDAEEFLKIEEPKKIVTNRGLKRQAKKTAQQSEFSRILKFYPEYAGNIGDLFKNINMPEVQTGNGWTPLHLAVAMGDIGLVKTFLKNGAVFLRDSNGFFPHEVDQLLEFFNPRVDYLKGKTITAIAFGNQWCLELFSKMTPSISRFLTYFPNFGDSIDSVLKNLDSRESVTGNGWTPLHVAVSLGDIFLVRFLLSMGATILDDLKGHHPCSVDLLPEFESQRDSHEAVKNLVLCHYARQFLLTILRSILNDKTTKNLDLKNLLPPSPRHSFIKELAGVLAENDKLEEINLEDNKIKDQESIRIVQGLMTNTNVKVLNLGSNKIGDVGACEIVKILHVNKTLKKINLEKNRIGDIVKQALIHLRIGGEREIVV